MANLVKTNLFCKNKEDFNELLILLIQYGVLSQKVTMEALDMETNSISFCSKWNVPFNEIRAISNAVGFDFYIEHAGETVVDGVGEAVYHNGEVIDGADFYDDDSLDIARIFLRINGQDCYRYDKTSGETVFIEGENVDDDPDLAVIDTTSEILENFLSRKAGVRYQRNCNKMSIEEWMILISEIFNIEQDWFIGDINGTYISDGYMDSFGFKHFTKQVENEIAAYLKKENCCTDGYYSPFEAAGSTNKKQCAKPFVLVSAKRKTVEFLNKEQLEKFIEREKNDLLNKYQEFLQEDLVASTVRSVFFIEGTVKAILQHRPHLRFLINGKHIDEGCELLNTLPEGTLNRKTRMFFTEDASVDYDAIIL